MKWTTEAKVGAFSLAGIILFTIIIVHLSTLVIFGRSGFLVTGYFKEAEGIEKGNPIHYAGVEVGMVDNIAVKTAKRYYRCASIMMPRFLRMLSLPFKPAVSWAEDSSRFPEAIRTADISRTV